MANKERWKKTCQNCGKEFMGLAFSKWCKPSCGVRKWQKKHPEKHNANVRRYYHAHVDQCRAKEREYYRRKKAARQ